MGNKVIEAQHVAKAFGEKVLFDDLNFMLPPNGIVGIIGPNGAGKTTMFRLIMELEKADKGSFDIGETVKVAYVDQTHKDLHPESSVYEVVSQGCETFRMGGKDMNARAYLSKFNFTGADQEKKIGVMVDSLIGEEDVVIKPLRDQFTNSPGIAGASILGDGSVSLIIDVSQLLELGVKQELLSKHKDQQL